jgi:hypothetical protein
MGMYRPIPQGKPERPGTVGVQCLVRLASKKRRPSFDQLAGKVMHHRDMNPVYFDLGLHQQVHPCLSCSSRSFLGTIWLSIYLVATILVGFGAALRHIEFFAVVSPPSASVRQSPRSARRVAMARFFLARMTLLVSLNTGDFRNCRQQERCDCPGSFGAGSPAYMTSPVRFRPR